ncbi:hypothetical protein ACT7TN_002482 [Vibrio cholerae]
MALDVCLLDAFAFK